jgi:formimidoylglutamate deiminase
MRDAGVVAGLCPTTEANLGDGIFPFDEHFALGGRWGVGGDSHVSRSPFEELRALEYSQRLSKRVRNVTASEAVPDVAANLWQGACAGGAQALGQPVGMIAVGRRADLVVLDTEGADFESLTASPALAVAMFSGIPAPVRDVYVGGVRVVHDGHHDAAGAADENFRAALKRVRNGGRL